jgi:hypothetical protein
MVTHNENDYGRGPGDAAMDELLGFKIKPKPLTDWIRSLPSGAELKIIIGVDPAGPNSDRTTVTCIHYIAKNEIYVLDASQL